MRINDLRWVSINGHLYKNGGCGNGVIKFSCYQKEVR